jgi:hypothetical protein
MGRYGDILNQGNVLHVLPGKKKHIDMNMMYLRDGKH